MPVPRTHSHRALSACGGIGDLNPGLEELRDDMKAAWNPTESGRCIYIIK